MGVEVLFDISEPGGARSKGPCGGRVVGIDLGTTNSLVAAVQGGQPACLGELGDRLVPSVVHYDGGQVSVGRAAQEQGQLGSGHTISSVKRFMGRGPADDAHMRQLQACELAPLDASDTVVRLRAGDRSVTPIEVSAEILRVLRARAEDALGGPLDGVVITVPAYFDDAQRQATRDAGRLAGLEVLRLLNEPTAAALAYGLDKQAEGTFLVFDLGGGTFDVSILKLQDGVFEVKATAGDAGLGGDDFDQAIATHLLRLMGVARTGRQDRKLLRRVLEAARAAKEQLSDVDEVALALEKPDGSVWRGHLTRRTLERLVRTELFRCGPPVRRALADAGLTPAGLDGVVLVGGATRMPLVRDYVRELLGQEPKAGVDPDEVVALGAAIQADLLARGGREDVTLLDVVPLSLGLETMGGVVEKLIHRNTTVPCGATQTFTTYASNQTGFDLHVVQGERELVGDCRSLARFKLTGIPPMPAGMARLEVTFLVDADGILRVSAREEVTGKETRTEVKPSYGLAEDEIERMLLDSFAHAESDVLARQLTELRVEADGVLSATEAAMAATPELATAQDRAAIARAVASLQLARAGHDVSAIRGATQDLDAAAKAFAQRRMEWALAQGLQGRHLAQVESDLAPNPQLATSGKLARVRFEPDGIEVDVPAGTSLLDAARLAGAPVGSACGGVCACSTCHVYVKQGAGHLSALDDEEEDILDKAFAVESTSRLGCQARIEKGGLFTVAITPESRRAFLDEHPDLRGERHHITPAEIRSQS